MDTVHIVLSVKGSSPLWRVYNYWMSERDLQCLISLCYIILKIPSHLVLPDKGAEASVLILTLSFFFFSVYTLLEL